MWHLHAAHAAGARIAVHAMDPRTVEDVATSGFDSARLGGAARPARPGHARRPGRRERGGGDVTEPDVTEPSDGRADGPRQVGETWAMRRRRKIREEIERNRRGEHTVPTWVLAVLLVAIVTGWILFIALV